LTFPLRTLDLSASIYRVREGTFGLVPDMEVSGNAWDATYRAGGPRHMRWVAELGMAPQHDDGAEDRRMTWDATIARLMGGYVAMRLHHPARIYPRGVGAGIFRPSRGSQSLGGEYSIDGAYLIDGTWHIDGGSTIAYVGTDAARYTDALHMTGLWPSATVFHAGDHFETGGNLYMVTATCVSDANGECTVPFLWKLWKPALEGDQINLHKPSARFVLASKDSGVQRYDLVFGAASLSGIEIPYVE